MKFRNHFYAVLCGLAVVAGFASCDDDDEAWNPEAQGSKIEMARTRAFILNEGTYQNNNAHLMYFDYSKDAIYEKDIFLTQNSQNIGDTGQDLIEYDDNLYLVAYGSKYIVKMNGVGKEQARLSLANHKALGDPRFMVGSNGYIYLTTYGGYVAKIDTRTMTVTDSVKVGQNPEQIIEEDGKLYCVNSGWGYDNTMSIINENDFKTVETVTIMQNPQAIIETDDNIVIQGYGGKYPNYTYPVMVYDKATKKTTEIGKGTNIAGHDGIVYVVNTTTDYNTTPYSGTTQVYSYNLKTKKTDNNVLKNMPEELKNSTTYGISINDETGHIYVLGTNYTWGDGVVYHFDQNGNYVGKFSSYGQNPKKIVFLDD